MRGKNWEWTHPLSFWFKAVFGGEGIGGGFINLRRKGIGEGEREGLFGQVGTWRGTPNVRAMVRKHCGPYLFDVPLRTFESS